MLEIGYGCDRVTLSEETKRNGEHKPQPGATTPVFYSTTSQGAYHDCYHIYAAYIPRRHLRDEF
ncbi:MAG: hypothetical protein B6D35_12480 [Candidatus Brocadia sp. UTAMX2]|nr:MAG: hypothetical protein B6D35_12480 [Candidatus Brocadia sp. UTAMX2]